MDTRLEALETGTDVELYRLLRHLALNPEAIGDETLRAVCRFALERLGWLHAFWSGRPMEDAPFPPGGEANWMDVRGWTVMALDVLSAADPSLGRLPLNMPDPLIETYGRWFGDLTTEDFDRAPGALRVVEETLDRLAAAACPTLSSAAMETRDRIGRGR